MRHEVVVCTKDRPLELRRCLVALSRQVRAADRIVVVDSSEIMLVAPAADFPDVMHVAAAPGLTHQRNVALSLLLPETGIVHFMDDDAVPEPSYLLAMMALFSDRPETVGAMGHITNLPEHKPWRLERLFLLNSRRQGGLLSSGTNVLAFDGSDDYAVRWLSGCCMSYRTEAILDLQFDERRTGNGLGEDVDFSARVSDRGPLMWCAGARIAHLQSAVNRESAAMVVRRDVRHRWQLARDRVGCVRRLSVIYSTTGIVLLGSMRALWGRTLGPLTTARAALLGLTDLALRRCP